MTSSSARLIAFYLPQFHPIPENDEWWGKGFTEWTNVAKAKPLFPGHHQPNLPADLGFYDLRVPETRIAQADLARQHGIEGFCYWHYWFGGRRILQRPFEEVLESGEPNFPFCLAWAVPSWTGVWYGEQERILIEQTSSNREDYERHFAAVLPALRDRRYICVDGKPLFLIFFPEEIPNLRAFTEVWRDLANSVGLKGLYLLATDTPSFDYASYGFDGLVPEHPNSILTALNMRPAPKTTLMRRAINRVLKYVKNGQHPGPTIVPYSEAIKLAFRLFNRADPNLYPCVLPSWDNTPRSGANGLVLQGSSPELFRAHLREAITLVAERRPEHRLVFLKAWNEWAEGNYMEPDQRFGHDYLEVVKSEMGQAAF